LASKPQNIERDKRKDELLTGLGYKVLRFSGHEVDKFSDKQLANNIIGLLSS
jgi:very-short-patch-repair endonuclease